ncbi:MAG: hypothetical protein IKV35_00210, partial [Clostridia bacterium]|nr:hypothetical protein [Clostridia bacterium]
MKTLARVTAVVLTLVLLVGIVPVSAAPLDAPVTYYLKDEADSIKVIGRAEVTAEGLVPHTTASGFAFYSDCSGDIKVTISGSSKLFDAQYFIVYVDGEIHTRIAFVHGKNRSIKSETFTAASGLTAGMHRIEIYRETEEINASCVINSITLNGTLIPVPNAPMMIEFVGDSITTGFGAYPVTAESEAYLKDYPYGDHPIRQAGTKSYAFLTAAALGMDFQACCTSGYGVEIGYNVNPDENLQLMYPYTAYHHDSSDEAMWSFERPADIVVINLGTNDIGAGPNKGVRQAQILEGVENMMKLAREKNPNAKIVWVTGMMGDVYKKYIENIVKDLGGAENGYYFCKLPKGMSGGGGHPDESEHIAASETLVAFLRENVLPADYATSFKTEADVRALMQHAKLTESDRAIAELEIAIAKKNGGDDAMLTATYDSLQAKINAASAPMPKLEEDEKSSVWLVVVVVVAAVVVAAAVA